MKNTELFDLLGEIDDKFFEEAKQPDAGQPDEIVISERTPFKALMSIFLPVAACIAVIVTVIMGANIIAKNGTLFGPNESDSDVSISDSSEIRLEDYPPLDLGSVPDIRGNGWETQQKNPYAKLQKATLATLQCGEYELYMLGSYIHIDKSNDPAKLYSYDVTLALVKDGKVISGIAPRFESLEIGHGGYELHLYRLQNYLEYYELDGGELILFKYYNNSFGTTIVPTTFFTIDNTDSLKMLFGDFSKVYSSTTDYCANLSAYTVDTAANTLTDNSNVYSFDCAKFDSSKSWEASYTVMPRFEPWKYGRYDGTNTPIYRNGEDIGSIPNLCLGSGVCGDYTIYLLCNELSFNCRKPDYAYPEDFIVVAEKDGAIINRYFIDVSDYELIKKDLAEGGVKIYEVNGKPLILITWLYHQINASDDGTLYRARFYTIDENGLTTVTGTDRDGYPAANEVELGNYYTVTEVNDYVSSENRLFLLSSFDSEIEFYLSDDTLKYRYVGSSESEENNLDLSEYPLVDMSKIPEVGSDMYDLSKALPKATIAEKQAGEYTLSIIGENLRTSSMTQKDDRIRIMVDGVRSVISRNGKIIRVTRENGTGVRTLMLYEDEIADLFPDTYEMADGIVFGLWKKSLDDISDDWRLGMIKNDTMIEFSGSGAKTDGYAPKNSGTVLKPEENMLILDGSLKCVFDFDNAKYTVTEEIPPELAGYMPYDGKIYETQPLVLLDTKKISGYKIHLLGQNVKAVPAEEFPIAEYDKLFIAVEKSGKIVDTISADNQSALNGGKLDKYLQPFEMKDGIGFVMYYSLDGWGSQYGYAMIYKIENDSITKLKYEYDFAPAPATGSPQYVGSADELETIYSQNAIVVDGLRKIVIDFKNGTFSTADSLINDIPSYGYSTGVQPYAVFDGKEIGAYRIALLGKDVFVEKANGLEAFGFSELYVMVEKDGEVLARTLVAENDVLLEEKVYDYLRPFEMKDGVGFVLYTQLDPSKNEYGDLYQSGYLYALNGDGEPVRLASERKDWISGTLTIDQGFVVIPEENGIMENNNPEDMIWIDFSTYEFKLSHK